MVHTPQFQAAPEVSHGRPVKLEIDERGVGHLYVGGEDVSRLVATVSINVGVGQKNRVKWGDPGDLRIEIGSPILALIANGDRDVKLREADRAALISLGWTPPTEEA